MFLPNTVTEIVSRVRTEPDATKFEMRQNATKRNFRIWGGTKHDETLQQNFRRDETRRKGMPEFGAGRNATKHCYTRLRRDETGRKDSSNEWGETKLGRKASSH